MNLQCVLYRMLTIKIPRRQEQAGEVLFIGYGVFRHEVMVKWAKYIIFVMIWIRTIANTGSASSTICGM